METVRTGVLDKHKEHYLRSKDKTGNDMMYQDIYNCICQNTKKWRYTTHYVKPTAPLLLKSRFPKGRPACKRQVFNPRHQTPQGKSVAKPETPLQNIQVGVAWCDIKGSDGTMLNPIFWKKVQGQNIRESERLQNAKYLVSKCCSKQLRKVTTILVLDYLS